MNIGEIVSLFTSMYMTLTFMCTFFTLFERLTVISLFPDCATQCITNAPRVKLSPIPGQNTPLS